MILFVVILVPHAKYLIQAISTHWQHEYFNDIKINNKCTANISGKWKKKTSELYRFPFRYHFVIILHLPIPFKSVCNIREGTKINRPTSTSLLNTIMSFSKYQKRAVATSSIRSLVVQHTSEMVMFMDNETCHKENKKHHIHQISFTRSVAILCVAFWFDFMQTP